MATRQPAVVIILMLAHLAMPVAAAAQAGNVPRINILELASPSASVRGHKAFQEGLRELGYVEGKNVILEYRYANGKLDLLPELAADLVRLKVDAIVTRSTASIRAAKNASKTIPIVFTNAGERD
jgi:putative ABC transport system substrate-binding protein